LLFKIQLDNYDEENNMEYSEEFIGEKELKESIKKEVVENEINLEDYKDIHENQKFQTKLNFFENSIDSSIIIKPQKTSNNNVVNSIVIEKKNKNDFLNQNNFKPNPADRIPRDISNNNIEKLNSIFDKYKGALNSNTNKNTLEDKKHLNNKENIFSSDNSNNHNKRTINNQGK